MSEESSPPPLECVVLTTLHRMNGMSAAELAGRVGISSSLLSLHERSKVPEADRLDKLLAALGYSRSDFQELLAVFTRMRDRGGPPAATPVDPSPEERREIRAIAAGLGSLAERLALEALTGIVRERKAAVARAEAEELCARLEKEPKPWLVVEKVRELQKWAVAEALAHRSAEAAVERPDRARELAALGHRVAELASCEGPFGQRLLGYTLTFGENTARAVDDLAEAEALFASAEEHWRAGAAAPGPLAEWRRLGLAGSLRRDQQRFAEALAVLDASLAIAPDAARPGLLVSKALTLEKTGKAETSLELLAEAEGLVDRERDPRLLFIVRFNHAALLSRLGRHGLAETRMQGLETLAKSAGDLNRTRLRWLRGSVDAGMGRWDAAEAGLEAACRELAGKGAVREHALASLELAVLLCRRSRFREAGELVRGLDWVLREEKISRQASEALQLVRGAADGPGMTLELAERALRLLLSAPKADAEPPGEEAEISAFAPAGSARAGEPSVPLVDGGRDDAGATAGIEDAAAVRRPGLRRRLRRSAGRPEAEDPGGQAVEEAGGLQRVTAPRKGR